ncbi:probable polygalacturonase [Oryza brachyantha]|uniref:probable polygalacturonase n=1 Tax=Oryza brachyantha TaxID=4533 RepID=UPI001ADCBDE6|nr:probable polygalacturonase [Oryza brachyantha]
MLPRANANANAHEPTPRPCRVPVAAAAALLIASSYLALTYLAAAAPLAALIGHGAAPASRDSRSSCAGFYRGGSSGRRAVSASVEEFGAVGDGVTSNTAAFRRAVAVLDARAAGRGARLEVPPGRWVTGSFNLTSRFTLFLHHGAILLGSQDPEEWPLIAPLPSYGRGRERLGPRHISLIHGEGLNDVVITGDNGTIDGQGRIWWDLWWNRTLNHTRGHLIELVNSTNIMISNITLRNSPFWTVHPVYCRNVVIRNLTVLAPLNAPNTDGIDPDSSSEVCIEDCYIESGDDLVAIKSGWDQYGISVGKPSSNIIIQRVSGTTPTCSGVGLGSEMSGGISNVIVRDLHIWNSAQAVRIKSDVGRGGYITNITIENISMEKVKVPIRFSRGADDHSDDRYDRSALPRISDVRIRNVVGVDLQRAPILEAVHGAVYEGICFRNVSLRVIRRQDRWQCESVYGEAHDVFPAPCEEFRRNGSSWCGHS